MKEKEGIIDVSDDICGICKDGGELILCDNCPSTFHVDCIGLKVSPISLKPFYCSVFLIDFVAKKMIMLFHLSSQYLICRSFLRVNGTVQSVLVACVELTS